jgi:hypothetical protein
MQPLYAVIASGQNISADVDLRRRVLIALACPVVDSAVALAFQGNIDNTSAGFVRISEPRFGGSLEARFQIGGGSLFINFPRDQGFYSAPFMRLETLMPVGSAQTNPRTFVLMTVPRGTFGQ